MKNHALREDLQALRTRVLQELNDKNIVEVQLKELENVVHGLKLDLQ